MYYVDNEHDRLKTIILGGCQCTEIKMFNELLKIFRKYNVKVLRPKPINDIIGKSIWVRDSAVIIGNKKFLLLGKNRRKYEYKSIKHFFKSYEIPDSDKIELEGGDILQNNKYIFLGIGERTNQSGYEWLKKRILTKKIIPINHSALHLDCCFVLLPNNKILFSKKYISSLPQFLIENFDCINLDNIVKNNVDVNLSTNFLFINNKTIICAKQPEFDEIYVLLKKYGFNLILIDLCGYEKLGGGIRCLTQPLFRAELKKKY